ncbi:MAG TPA: hypothetical protein DCZ05_13010 [Deltaproteobacteria bacterium]|nr:hypothetical protein [Deltaproteobacteria bacterium]
MERVVQKFSSFDEADNADYEYYRTLSGNEKLQLLLELIMPENPDAAVIERSARVHPLTEHEECDDEADIKLLEKTRPPRS